MDGMEEMLKGIEHEIQGKTLILHQTIKHGTKLNWNGFLIANCGAETHVSISGPKGCTLFGDVDDKFDFIGNGDIDVQGNMADLPFIETEGNIKLTGDHVGRGGYFYTAKGRIIAPAYLGEGCNLFSPGCDRIHVNNYHDSVTFNARKLREVFNACYSPYAVV